MNYERIKAAIANHSQKFLITAGFFACCRAEMIANDKILAFDRSVVLVEVAPVKISPALIEQISKETGLKIGGRLFSDAL